MNNPTPEEMWEKFVRHIEKVEPFRPPKPGEQPVKHINLIGSIVRYRKLFLEANK